MTSLPSILLTGDFLPDRLASSYERAFIELGCKVACGDTRELEGALAPWLRNRVGHRVSIESLAARRYGSHEFNRAFLRQARATRPDLVFILNGDFLMPETIEAARRLGSSVFIFHADNPFPPCSQARPEHLPSALSADCYFIWSRSLITRLQALGARRVKYLPFAWDPEVFPYQGDSYEFDHDVVFVGGWDREREELLNAVADCCDLRIWGPPYWATRTRRTSAVRRCWQGGAVTGEDAARLLSRARIALNILRRQNLPDGTNMRTFEVPGCGGMLLATRSAGAESIFPAGAAGAYFHDARDCCERIDALLSHPAEQRRIRATAHSIVASGQTYVDRARTVLAVFDELRAQSRARG